MFEGSICALITPFRDGELDKAAFERFVDWQIEQGTHGLVPCGTTGESPTLSHAEHDEVIEICIKVAAGRRPVMAGTGSNATAEAVRLTRHAQKAGADAALVVTPYYNKPNQEGIYQHFKAVHDATDIPLYIYNIPGRSVVEISVDTMARLAELPRIVGTKDATTNMIRAMLEQQKIASPFTQLSGEDASTYAYMAVGGRGAVSVSANVAPNLCAAFQEACLRQDWSTAKALNDRLMPLHQVLFTDTSPQPTKYALSRLGRCQNELRLPLVPTSATVERNVDEVLTGLGLLD